MKSQLIGQINSTSASLGAVLQRKCSAAPPIVHETLLSSGRPPDTVTRELTEGRFRHDFSKVRTHTDVSRHSGSTLPYRQATELLECIRIMGEANRDYCREVVLGEKPTPVEETPKWTRKRTRGPTLLDGRQPSYQVWFNHILPLVPTGVTQMWQVVEVTKTFLTASCALKTENDFRVDIVGIGTRKKIEDSWGLIEPDDPPFVMEESKATIGFDDQNSKFVEQTNVKVSEADAKDTVNKMAGPKGVYSGRYTFVKSANCKDCPEKLKEIKEKNKAPNGEALTIEGVGSWTS